MIRVDLMKGNIFSFIHSKTYIHTIFGKLDVTSLQIKASFVLFFCLFVSVSNSSERKIPEYLFRVNGEVNF